MQSVDSHVLAELVSPQTESDKNGTGGALKLLTELRALLFGCFVACSLV